MDKKKILLRYDIMNRISKMNHSVTGDDSPLVFIQNKKNKREVKSRLSIAERINSMPDSRFKVCGGVKKNKKLLNSPLPDNSRILNDNDNIQVIEAKNNKIPQVNKNYKYIFQDRINTKKISNKYNKDKSTFRSDKSGRLLALSLLRTARVSFPTSPLKHAFYL